MIIGISGKKRSGKNTVANYLNGKVMKMNGMVEDFKITDEGKLEILTTHESGEVDWGILDIYRKDDAFVNSASEIIWPFVKNYSFADTLKETAINLFGLDPSSVYGNEEERGKPTHLLWENMPGNLYTKWDGYTVFDLVPEKTGPMTGREFMQYLGTEIGRKMHPPIWINSTINRINQEGSETPLITDVRFPDEVKAIQNSGGVVIRLTRKVEDDEHSSEISLDKNVYDWNNFDFVVDNQDITLQETLLLVEKLRLV